MNNKNIELNDILRMLYKDNEENYIQIDVVKNLVYLNHFNDYYFDGAGGFDSITWNLNGEFLENQSKETQEYLIKRHKI